MKQKNKIFTLLFVIFIQIQYANSQVYNNSNRAEHICDIPKYITWSTQPALKNFVICLLEPDSNLFQEVKKISDSGKLIHEKKIVVIQANKISEISECHVLFLNKENNFEINKVLEKIHKSTFLISENYDFHKSMINFIVIDGKRRFELNEKLINERGFSVKPLFAALAVKTKADWEALYNKTEDLLEHEIEVVNIQKEEIKIQKDEIFSQKSIINKQNSEIIEQKQILDYQKANLEKLVKRINDKQRLLNEKLITLKEQESEIIAQKEDINKQSNILNNQSKEIKEQTVLISNQKNTLSHQLEQIEKQQLILYFLIFILILVTVVIYVIYRAYKIKKLTNILLKEKNHEILLKNKEITKKKEEIEIQNSEILQQKEEIEAQRDEIEKQRDEIIEQHDIVKFQHSEILIQKKEITDSILYARRIQNAVLPQESFINQILSNNFFILNIPRDIVSGDYYWIANNEGFSVFAVADCTGHGVPGAFMSMLGVAFLNEVVNKKKVIEANEILNHLRKQVINSLHQTGKDGEAKDGMDIALCVLNNENNELQFSGANNPLYLIRRFEDYKIKDFSNQSFNLSILESTNAVLLEIKGDKMPIGIYVDEDKSFTNKTIQLFSNDTIYIFSDGFADQFGGPFGKKFKYKNFKEILMENNILEMKEQKKLLERTIHDWQGKLEQVDDICIMGLRIS